MVLRVFLSTAITGIDETEKNDIYNYVDKTIRMEYEG